MSKLTLFQLSRTLESLVDEILSAEESGEDCDDLYALLDEIEAGHGRKIQSYIHVIKNAEATAKACKEEASRFSQRARACGNLVQRLKGTLLDDLNSRGHTQAHAGHFSIKRGETERVEVSIDPADLPQEYQRVSIDANKTELKRALKRGERIKGAELAKAEHLRIRVK